MDRTKEYFMIIQHTEIPQNGTEKIDFYSDLEFKEQEIERLLEKTARITPYESFKAPNLLEACSKHIKEFKSVRLEEDGTRDRIEAIKGLQSILNTRSIRFTIRLNDISRKLKKDVSKDRGDSEDEKPKDTPQKIEMHAKLKQELYFQQPLLEEESKNEFMEERKRIVASISEIGQVVEEISMHVNLQEEQLKRIDDILLKTDNWSDKAVGELNEVLNYARANRKFMLKFFLFWFLLAILFWLIRRLS